ncbi:MAG TPA: TonB-dependent receptor [Terriglobales bacterium]|nr:TonB-dependent receptor [Terriglobales bacterium]
MKLSRSLLLMFALMPAAADRLVAQTSEGRILGTVYDQTGAAINSANITVTNVDTNVSRRLVTTKAGEYVAPNLQPGPYTVAAEAAGFKKAVSTQFILEVSRDARMDLRLQPGAVNETITVSAEGSLVDTTDTTLNGVLSNKAVSELPVQGRDFQNLLELHPGVQRTPGGGFHSVTSNGNRPDDNNFFIDGADDNDAYYGETVVNDAGIQGTPASFLPLDAIQEFNTQESPTADYGVKPGVVMNIGIKSGTNDLHGSAYYFHRNAAFDARNYFNPAPTPLAALIMHEFGVSLGGPIKKDKWFYFVNYEGIRDKVGNPGVVDSPVTKSLASLTSQFPDGVSAPDGTPESALYSVPDAITYFDPTYVNYAADVAYCQNNFDNISTCTLNPLSQQLTDPLLSTSLLLPNPGFTASQSDPSAIDFDFNNKNRGDNLVAKTNYVLNKSNVLSARFIYANTNQIEEDAFPLRPEWLSTTSPITKVFGVSLASTPSSAWSNEVRFSYNSFNESILPVDHNRNPSTYYGLNTGVTDPRLFGFPRINPGSSEFNYMGGNSSWPLNTSPIKTYSFGDTASYIRGRQTMRFGGTFRYGDVDYYRAGYGRGRIDFRHLWNFMAGDVRRWRFLYGDPHRQVSQKSMGFFLEDDVKATRNLTLNLGVRYDLTGTIHDAHDMLANYVPTSTTGLVQVGQGLSSLYPTNHYNFSPRIGFAWDVRGTGKTVVRAAYGIIFEQPSIRTFMFNGGGLNLNPTGIPYIDANGVQQQPSGTITSFLQISSDGTQINWLAPNQTPTIFPNATNSGNICSVGSQCSVFAVDQHLKTPYVMNWNFNVQQALTPTMLLQVAYVASHGVKLYSVTDINQVNPAYDDGSETIGRPLATNCPVSGGGQGFGGPCFPWLGFFNYLSNRSNSNFNSLQVTLTKRYSHGLYLLAGYTYGHAIDTATSNLAGVPPDSNNYNEERGNGDYDIRHRFTLSASYEFPSIKTKWQMLEGWQATSIVNLQTGAPYTLGDVGNDISFTGELNDRWNMSGNPKDIHWSAKHPLPYFDFSDTAHSDAACLAQATTLGTLDNLNFYGCYHSGSAVITPPADMTQGNMGRNIFIGPGFANWDFSLTKIWRLNERVKLQFRGEVFNILNHTNFAGLNTDLSVPTTVGTVVYTPDVGAANPVIGSGGSRHIQLGAKIIW